MKKKKLKYAANGIGDIIDPRTAAQKTAWESTFQTPIVPNPNASPNPLKYDLSQSYRDENTLNNAIPIGDQQVTETRGTGVYDLHPAFSAVNTLALATTGIAQAIQNGKSSRAEKLKYIQSLQNRFRPDNPTMNDQPMYMAEGGEIKVDNNVRSEWNNYVKWLASVGKKGAPELDTDGAGFNMLDEYRKVNPKTVLTKDYITPIQKDFQQYRNWAIEQHKSGKLKVNGDVGEGYKNFMTDLSIVDGYPGSKTTSHTFPQNYFTLNDNGSVSTENKGFASDLLKMPYGGGPLTSEGAKEILRDGKVHGKNLTDKQKRYFGYIAGGGKPKAKYGTDIPETSGLPDHLAKYGIVEAEGGEAYTDQQNNVISISDNAPSHEQGGVMLDNVNRVLEDTSTKRKDIVSKSLIITPDMFNQMFNFTIKRPVSHATALDKAHEYFSKQSKKVENGLKKGIDILERNKNDYLAHNSTDLNLKTAQSIPTKNHIFDLLFQHQEEVKDMLGVTQDKAKYGKYIAKIGYDDDIDPYPGGKTKSGRRTPTGKDNAFQLDKEKYKSKWKSLGLDPDKMTNAEFQSKAYDYILKNSPDVARKMWADYGNTAKGIKQGIGKNYDFENLSREQLKNLKGAYVDGLVGVRTLQASLPENKPYTPNLPSNPSNLIPEPIPEIPDAPAPDAPFKLRPSGEPSRFNEPLRWYDVAGPLMSLTDSERIPAQYNPVELNEVRLKLQNPTPALEAGNRDYNAALSMLPNSGAGMANVSNAFSSKYSMDNQILGQYENINNQIKNQEILYNSGIRDKQSALDQQSRAVFEQQYLGSREAARQQKLTAFDDLFTRVALNRKLNREGNLLMQMTPNFDQYGKYNGNQRYMTSPTLNGDTTGDASGISYVTDPQTGRRYPIFRDKGKLQSKSKILQGLTK